MSRLPLISLINFIIAVQFSTLIKRLVTILCISLIPAIAGAQVRYSLSADLSVIRSFKKQQRFTTIGQTIAGNFHITPKTGAYAWFAYSAKGKFSNDLLAAAKSPATTPATIPYQNRASLDFRHISLGLRQYIKGSAFNEEGWNLYGIAGFGIMFGRIVNTHNTHIDTAQYQAPVLSGTGKIRRLTLDLGIGYEWSFPGGLYLFSEARMLCPVSDYPSAYLLVSDDAPLAGMLTIGVRMLFD